jgi:hypothetical protein
MDRKVPCKNDAFIDTRFAEKSVCGLCRGPILTSGRQRRADSLAQLAKYFCQSVFLPLICKFALFHFLLDPDLHVLGSLRGLCCPDLLTGQFTVAVLAKIRKSCGSLKAWACAYIAKKLALPIGGPVLRWLESKWLTTTAFK